MTLTINSLYSEISLLKNVIFCMRKEIDLIKSTCCTGESSCLIPVIVTQPQAETVTEGDPFELSVLAVGETPLTYQWRLGGAPILDATGQTYSVEEATSDDAGVYSVVVTNSCGSDTSENATVIINPPVVHFTASWGWIDVLIGDPADFPISGSGSFVTGATVVADFRDNTEPKYLFVKEPIDQPAKTKWFGTDLNKGDIDGTQGESNLFFRLESGSFRYYITNYLTQQEDTTIQFKVS